MNLSRKVTSLLVASLALFTTTFAQNTKPCKAKPNPVQEQPKSSPNPTPMMPGYSASAAIAVDQSWDFFGSAAFTYWQASNDANATYIEPIVYGTGQNTVVLPNREYKPGFEIALGLNLNRDGWDTLTRYTWFRGTTLTNESLPQGGDRILNTMYGYEFNSKWKLHMDLLDWEIGRSYFVGSKLSFRPFMAARAAWIRQNFHEVYSGNGNDQFNINRTHSWGVGPRFGLKMDWMVGQGIRLFGDCGMDTLFTQYTTIYEASSEGAKRYGTFTHNKNVLRTHLDVELGLGWGMYFAKDAYHIDLTAGYGFQTFFRQYLDGSTTGAPDLYLQGLTTSARFDF